VTERFVAALFGLLLSGSAVAADFLVEVRVLVQRGCMLVTQPRDAGAQALGLMDLGSILTWAVPLVWMARMRH